MATFTKDHPFLCIPSSCRSPELRAGRHHTLASPTPPSQLHKHCRWRRIRVAGYAPAGRTAANLHGASLLRAEGDFSPFSNCFPSHVPPPPNSHCTPELLGAPPSAPLAALPLPFPWGCLLPSTACWQESILLHTLPGQSTFPPTASRLSSPLGEGESSVAHSALSFPVSPLVSHDMFSLVVTTARSLNAVA